MDRKSTQVCENLNIHPERHPTSVLPFPGRAVPGVHYCRTAMSEYETKKQSGLRKANYSPACHPTSALPLHYHDVPGVHYFISFNEPWPSRGRLRTAQREVNRIISLTAIPGNPEARKCLMKTTSRIHQQSKLRHKKFRTLKKILFLQVRLQRL